MVISRLADMQLLYHDKDKQYLIQPQTLNKNLLRHRAKSGKKVLIITIFFLSLQANCAKTALRTLLHAEYKLIKI